MSTPEIVFSLVLVLALFGAKCVPLFARRLGGWLDDEAHDAGRSVGGIHGKPAAEALTPNNQVAEFYETENFRNDRNYPWWRRFVRRFDLIVRRLFGKQ